MKNPQKKSVFIAKKAIFIIVLFAFFSPPVLGQFDRFATPVPGSQNSANKAPNKISDRLRYGGFFSAQFGDITFIDISPRIHYLVSDRTSVGVGGTYNYFNNRIFRFSNAVYGGQIFSMYQILENAIIQGEFEMMNINPWPSVELGQTNREWVPGLLLGAGLRQPMGARGSVFVSVLYNVLWDPRRSLYNRPYMVRVGFAL
jgi:hypothetical protein